MADSYSHKNFYNPKKRISSFDLKLENSCLPCYIAGFDHGGTKIQVSRLLFVSRVSTAPSSCRFGLDMRMPLGNINVIVKVIDARVILRLASVNYKVLVCAITQDFDLLGVCFGSLDCTVINEQRIWK